VQKTGKMYYVYLPTQWCKDQGVRQNSKVTLLYRDDGSISIYPEYVKKERTDIDLSVEETDEKIIHKLIIACFINPASKFRIKLEKKINYEQLLNQKKLISLELVEVSRDLVTCDSSITTSDIGSLLKTMIRKMINLMALMSRKYNEELIQKYEEEIDRSKLLIDKAAIDALTFSYGTQRFRNIEVHYISLLAKDLERIADHIITLKKQDTHFLLTMLGIMEYLKTIIEETLDSKRELEYAKAIQLIKKIEAIQTPRPNDKNYSDKKRIKAFLSNIAEVIIDWAITSYLTEKGENIKRHKVSSAH
jgi:phosphate uptake regulator